MLKKTHHFYNFLKLIPNWKVVTYKILSDIFGFHPRTIWQLLKANYNQHLYPCYKVIKTDLSLWWYNLWLSAKEQKLIQSWVRIVWWKVDRSCIWTGKISNCFFGFPLIWKDQVQLNMIINKINSLGKFSSFVSFQNPLSSHVTVLFLWNISLSNYHSIINNLNSIKINLWLSDFWCCLDKLNNFDNKIYYLCSDNQILINKIENVYKNIISNLHFEHKKTHYVHHLTLFRVKSNCDEILLKELIDILSNYKCSINIDTVRFYITYDNVKQIPIADITI